jgi:DNA-binding Lrp family transcriptional regulator
MTPTRQRLYNPAQLSPQERAALFAVRDGELTDLLRTVKRHKKGQACNHTVIIGARGMGKSTLALTFLDKVRETKTLAKKWQPIPFPEESYGITNLGELWTQALELLSDETGDPQWAETAQYHFRHEKDDARLEQYTYAELLRFREESGKIPLILLENLDLIFGQINDEKELSKLRAHLMGKDDILLLGTATHLFDEISDDKNALFAFLRPITLGPLSSEACLTLMRTIAESEDDEEGLEIIKSCRARIEAIRQITGGNPRLNSLSYRLLRDSPAGDAKEDLERLIDQQTPYFQARIEKLPPQARKVFHAIAKLWRPATTREIAEEVRLDPSKTSAQIATLVERGYVEKIGNSKKTKYQVVERFYNVYYLIRFTRNESQLIEGIIDFLGNIFGIYGLISILDKSYQSTDEIGESGLPKSLEVTFRRITSDPSFKIDDPRLKETKFFQDLFTDESVEGHIEEIVKQISKDEEKFIPYNNFFGEKFFGESGVIKYRILAFVLTMLSIKKANNSIISALVCRIFAKIHSDLESGASKRNLSLFFVVFGMASNIEKPLLSEALNNLKKQERDSCRALISWLNEETLDHIPAEAREFTAKLKMIVNAVRTGDYEAIKEHAENVPPTTPATAPAGEGAAR